MKKGDIYYNYQLLAMIAQGQIPENSVVVEVDTPIVRAYYFKVTGFKRVNPDVNSYKFLHYMNLNRQYVYVGSLEEYKNESRND